MKAFQRGLYVFVAIIVIFDAIILVDLFLGNSGKSIAANPVNPVNVRAVQEVLKQKGFNPGPVDGILGPRTISAVMAYTEARNGHKREEHTTGASLWLARLWKEKETSEQERIHKLRNDIVERKLRATIKCEHLVKASATFPETFDSDLETRVRYDGKTVAVFGQAQLMQKHGMIQPHTFFCSFENEDLKKFTITPG
ncbi:MAG: peptidoglycan-binding domain-containing protein [Rhodospirillales bacterium]